MHRRSPPAGRRRDERTPDAVSCVRRAWVAERKAKSSTGARGLESPQARSGAFNAAIGRQGATNERPEAPAQSAPPVGGREDGTLGVRSGVNARPPTFKDGERSD